MHVFVCTYNCIQHAGVCTHKHKQTRSHARKHTHAHTHTHTHMPRYRSGRSRAHGTPTAPAMIHTCTYVWVCKSVSSEQYTPPSLCCASHYHVHKEDTRGQVCPLPRRSAEAACALCYRSASCLACAGSGVCPRCHADRHQLPRRRADLRSKTRRRPLRTARPTQFSPLGRTLPLWVRRILVGRRHVLLLPLLLRPLTAHSLVAVFAHAGSSVVRVGGLPARPKFLPRFSVAILLQLPASAPSA